MIRVEIEPTFDAFRAAARDLLANDTAPSNVAWDVKQAGAQRSLFGGEHAASTVGQATPSARRHTAPHVPAELIALAELAVLHREADRFDVVYEVLYRVTHGERKLLEIVTDPRVARLRALAQAVKRDEHKMHAFVRFRRTDIDGEDHYVSWYEPDHHIVRLAAPFFARRFATMKWSILTPDESAFWDGESLRFGPGAPREAAPSDDELEELFRTYYRSIFNPARVNLRAMRAEMPTRFWNKMPETRIIAELVKDARPRVDDMRAKKPSASEAWIPTNATLPVMRDAAAGCRACPLYTRATQTVFGEGPTSARIMLVGEQPGDEEDQRGHPFVGPAGRVLDEALAEAGVDRASLYVTNAVKHFKWEPRGKRRMHARPSAQEVEACHGWLEGEIAAVKPRTIVCLGATAAQSFVGQKFRITRDRGRIYETPWAPIWLATYHPAAILRMEDAASALARAQLVADLKLAADATQRES